MVEYFNNLRVVSNFSCRHSIHTQFNLYKANILYIYCTGETFYKL